MRPMRMAVLLLLALAPLAVRPSIQAPTETTLFFDEFSGPTLDRSRWNVVVTGRTVNNEQQAYIDSPDVFTFLSGDAEGATNGALVIRPRYREGFTTPQGRRFDFVSGRADTSGQLRVHARHRVGADQADRRRRPVAGVLVARRRAVARHWRDRHHGARGRAGLDQRRDPRARLLREHACWPAGSRPIPHRAWRAGMSTRWSGRRRR